MGQPASRHARRSPVMVGWAMGPLGEAGRGAAPSPEVLCSARLRTAGEGGRCCLQADSGDRVMDRRAFIGILAGGLLIAPLAAEAQRVRANQHIRCRILPRRHADNTALRNGSAG
jgi:hypothetical protein